MGGLKSTKENIKPSIKRDEHEFVGGNQKERSFRIKAVDIICIAKGYFNITFLRKIRFYFCIQFIKKALNVCGNCYVTH